MTAGELYQAGKLPEAIDAQVAEVRSHPADHARRLFLFELLAFAGDLDRAGRQLDAVRYDDPGLEAAVQGYRKLLDAEQARRRLFADGVKPEFLAESPEHVGLRLEAVNRLRENRPAEAAALLARAEAAGPGPLRGQLNGKPFETLRDADDLFGTVLEVMAHGTYYWVPLEQVVALAMNAPRFPRDLLWVPARLELEGARGDVFLPALYPGSHEHPDPAVKLGRGTDWKSAEGGPVLGVGLRTFLVGEDPVSLLEWRQLEVGGPAAS
jgi:type VI secretion system protein ImpE